MAKTASDRSVTAPAAVGGPWALLRHSPVEQLQMLAGDVRRHLAESLAGPVQRGLRPSFAPVLGVIRAEGLAVGRIADELGISLQAASQAAGALEALGCVTRTPNPADRRSRLVVLTDEGRRIVEAGSATILACETNYAALVGSTSVAQLARDVGVLATGGPTADRGQPVFGARSDGSLGAVILVGLRARDEVLRRTASRGHAAVRASHHGVLAVIAGDGAGGARVSEIARRQRVSRQAVSTTVLELEALGYLDRHRDDRDRRAVVFTLTQRGITLGEDTLNALARIESRYRNVLGDRRFTRFARTLAGLAAVICGEQANRGIGTDGIGGAFDVLDGGTTDLGELARCIRRRLGGRAARQLAALLVAEGPVPTPRARTGGAT